MQNSQGSRQSTKDSEQPAQNLFKPSYLFFKQMERNNSLREEQQ